MSKSLRLSIVILPIILIYWYFYLPDGLLHVYFLNVGQGDAIFIQSPSGKQILIDGGPSAKILEELSSVMSYFDRKIDIVMLSHPQSDHLFGLIDVLKKYEIEKIYITGITYESPIYSEFLKIAKDRGSQTVIADRSDDFTLNDGLFVDIIYPFESVLGESFTSANNSSLVSVVNYGKNSIFLGGDIEFEIEEALANTYKKLTADILKINHHGSKSSSSYKFLEKLEPKYAVIQSGRKNPFGHPNKETLLKLAERNIPVYRNDRDGRVEFVMDEDRILKIITN